MKEATDAELGIRPRDSAELVCAEMIGYFSTATGAMPADPILAAGHRAAHAWRALMSQAQPDPARIATLLRYVAPHRACSGTAWELLCLAIASWADTKGVRDPAVSMVPAVPEDALA